MLIQKFEDLNCWKLSRELTKEIYLLTSKNKFSKDYGLRDQLQRASVSIMLNIAEGFDSVSSKNIQTFFRYAYRSASEVRAIFYISLDLNYITQEEFQILIQKSDLIQRMITGLIKHVEKA